MKDHLDLSTLTFAEAIKALHGERLEDADRVVQTLLTFMKLLPPMRVNTFYQQAVMQRQFAFKDFKFITTVLYDMAGIADIYRQCKDFK